MSYACVPPAKAGNIHLRNRSVGWGIKVRQKKKREITQRATVRTSDVAFASDVIMGDVEFRLLHPAHGSTFVPIGNQVRFFSQYTHCLINDSFVAHIVTGVNAKRQRGEAVARVGVGGAM